MTKLSASQTQASMEISSALIPGVMLAAFLSEYVDSSLGMGYGTTLTPLLLLLGFDPLQVVPTVLLSEFVTGIFAARLHHTFGNVKLSRGSKDLKVALVLASFGLLGAVVAPFVAVRLPREWLSDYIGASVLVTGLLILLTRNTRIPFSWPRLGTTGLLAAFNKSIGGGGYGALVTGGQLLSGVATKTSIGVTSLAEGFVSCISLLTYVALAGFPDWKLSGVLLAGALLSAPLSALTVQRLRIPHLQVGVGVAASVLGVLTLLNLSQP